MSRSLAEAAPTQRKGGPETGPPFDAQRQKAIADLLLGTSTALLTAHSQRTGGVPPCLDIGATGVIPAACPACDSAEPAT